MGLVHHKQTNSDTKYILCTKKNVSNDSYWKKWNKKKTILCICITAFFWLFANWCVFTEKQKQKIEHLYCAGIRLIHNLWGWNVYVTLVLARDKSLLDYMYDDWNKLMRHLIESPEGNGYLGSLFDLHKARQKLLQVYGPT